MGRVLRIRRTQFAKAGKLYIIGICRNIAVCHGVVFGVCSFPHKGIEHRIGVWCIDIHIPNRKGVFFCAYFGKCRSIRVRFVSGIGFLRKTDKGDLRTLVILDFDTTHGNLVIFQNLQKIDAIFPIAAPSIPKAKPHGILKRRIHTHLAFDRKLAIR